MVVAVSTTLGSAPSTTTTKPMSGVSASASHLLSMLSEDDPDLRNAALQRLLAVVDTLWYEVAEYLPDLEAMAEAGDATAAAVASRVFYHLDEPTQALRLALMATSSTSKPRPFHSSVVDYNEDSAYAQCLAGAAVEAYVSRSAKQSAAVTKHSSSVGGGDKDGDDDDDGLDPEGLERAVEDLYASAEPIHALGMALDAGALDKVDGLLKQTPSLCAYALDASNRIPSRQTRREVLAVVAKSLYGQDSYSPPSIVKCHQLLDQPEPVASVLTKLLEKREEEGAEESAYQLCCDLVEEADPRFVARVAEHLPTKVENVEGDDDEDDNNDSGDAIMTPKVAVTRSDEEWTKFDKARRILIGGGVSELTLGFLHKASDFDVRIMENLKKALEERGGSRNSVLHHCAVVAHGYLVAGTTNDVFLRNNLDWMRKARNWSKFSATASLGVIHANHTAEAMTLLEPYLPTEETASETNGGYSEGGSLYALGLIHVSCGDLERLKEAREVLRPHLRSHEVVAHGASLGMGLASFGSGDASVVSDLKEVVETDSAVAGEAAGIAIGCVRVGMSEKDEVVAELLEYARVTHHEKIIRGIALGVAIMQYGREDEADASIAEMSADRDPVMRYGAQYATALAYCGTGNPSAVRSLLHAAVSDVSEDVRMAAVLSLAFVTPDRAVQLVALLLESFHPHVRYASCVAVGIASAGTGDTAALNLLEPMLTDTTDYVRQGATIGTAMIYMQQPDSKKLKAFREKLGSTLTDKHQTTLAKMGAVLATGLLDVGGRNRALSFRTAKGAVGLVLWLQHWHWFPMMHMIHLALEPTYVVGLTKDFKYPRTFKIMCHGKPSVFAYPKRLEEKKEKEKKRVETVTLSTTAKSRLRLARKRAAEVDDKKDNEDDENNATSMMDVVKTSSTSEESKEPITTTPTDMEEDDTPAPTPPKTNKPERQSFAVSNVSRMTDYQATLCTVPPGQRYKPVRPDRPLKGVVFLTSGKLEEEDDDDLAALVAPSAEGEAEPPEPFEWAPPGHPEYVAPEIPAMEETATMTDTKSS